MSITYELSEDEFEAIRDVKNIVCLVEALAANSINRIDVSSAELCAFTAVVLGKLRAVLDAADERHLSERELTAAFASSGPVIGEAVDDNIGRAIAEGKTWPLEVILDRAVQARKILPGTRHHYAAIGLDNMQRLVELLDLLPGIDFSALGGAVHAPAVSSAPHSPAPAQATRRSAKRSRREAVAA